MLSPRSVLVAVAILLTASWSQAAEPVAVGFETAQPGAFDKLPTEVGVWTSEAGRTIVDAQHAKTGKHCLQLTGGTKTSVVLEVSPKADTAGVLSFWAERWTVRKPFSFRIEKHDGETWQEIFNGDATVRVGRAFLNHVKIPLDDPRIQRLRWTVVSPVNTGVLIDDLRIAPAAPQKIVKVEVLPATLPALVGAESCKLVPLRIETAGSLQPIALTEIQAVLSGSENAAQWRLSQSSGDDLILEEPAAKSAHWKFAPQELDEGENRIWLKCQLKPNADIDQRIGAKIQAVKFSNGQTLTLDFPPVTQRLGVAVRQRGDDGAHTYRIPGLTTTNQGTLIAVYDIRRRGGGDLPGDIDVGMSRSTDGGRTWEPMQTIMDMGDDPQWRYDGIGDPAVLVDQNTGTIWAAATWSHGNRSWRGSGPGLKPEETGQLMLVRSDDDGKTWSKPINITEQVKRPQWCFLLQGPGKGITMRDGTLVFAAQYQDPPEKRRLPHSTILYSQDHGKTWKVGAGAFDDTTEAQVVESEPGVLMLNCRYNRKSARVVMTTSDLGKTWRKHPTSERALLEPRACMASLIDVDREVGQDVGGWLLFSNPDSLQSRRRITIKASRDRGETWPKEHRLLLDEDNGAGYSCMTMIDSKTVGIIYEGSQAHMTFQRIPLSDLIVAKPNPLGLVPPPPVGLSSALKTPRLFDHHAVLQAGAELPVWGDAQPNARVTVALGEATQTTTADPSGRWSVRFPPRKASRQPTILKIESGDRFLEFTDILIGEVWVCAGQSNMEWMLRQSSHGQEELSAADHPQLRLLHLRGGARGSLGSYTPEHLARLTPETYCDGRWKVASAESARDFSAVAWYFGRRLQEQLNVPVGLICPAVGGTPTEAWISRETLESELPEIVAGDWLDNERLGDFCRMRGQQNLLSAIQAGEAIPGDSLGPNHSFKPGFMWSAGIEPLIPYAIRGAIWYQGESNAETLQRVRQHRRLFPLLVEQWRKSWGQGDFPFLYVQLPAMNRPDWPEFREGQRRMLEQLNNVGMAVAIDTGLANNVHPPLKKPVGQRLAAWALGAIHQVKTFADYSGPLMEHAQREGDSLVVAFEHVGAGLKTSDNQPLRHFDVCGKDGVFHPATAKIIGKNTVAVSSPQVAEPVRCRYAWRAFPTPPVNLVNSANLPASPFSTDP